MLKIFSGKWKKTMLYNFSWVIPNKLAGSNLPGRSPIMGRFDSLEMIKDLNEIKEKGIDNIVSIIEDIPHGYEEYCKSIGLKHFWYTVDDYCAPSNIDTFRSFSDAILLDIDMGAKTVIHCKAGVGRTGLTLACIIGKILKLNSDDSIKYVRAIRPESIENQNQINFVRLFLDGQTSNHNFLGVLEPGYYD